MQRLSSRAGQINTSCVLCRSLLSPKWRYIISRQPLTAPRLRFAHSDSRPKITWYQQLFPWSSERRPADPSNPDLEEDNEEAKWLKSNIERLDHELREMSSDEHMIKPLLRHLSEEDQQRFRNEIQKDRIRESHKTKELARFLPELEIKWQLPPEQNAYLRILNLNMRKATVRMGESKLRKALWHSYARCKAFLPQILPQIPDAAWAILYKTQTMASLEEDQHWARNMLTLVDDMISVGKMMAPDQQLLYIEALRNVGRQDEAIAKWQESRKLVDGNRRDLAEYELLGVRLFTSPGNLEKAEQLASEYLRDGNQGDSRILIPILGTWIKRGDEIGMKHAWALYLRLKTQLGSEITMNEYDNVTLSFLEGARADLALAVFKDMMLTGQQSDKGSIDLYTKTLGILGKVQSADITVEELNTVPLTALTILPKAFQNRFFYGKWLKKLLGMGQTDAAGCVVELMYERGIKPDAKHLNGVIGAWFRSVEDNDKAKAEEMAWAMVYERIEFVRDRQGGLQLKVTEQASTLQIPIPRHLDRTAARANVETFALLLQHYTCRNMDGNIDLVQKALNVAEIPPNHFILNHLLYRELRRSKLKAAWSTYQDMTRNIKPDLQTFSCLWECEKAHLDSLAIRRDDHFPGPRRVMFEMISWYGRQSPTSRHAVRDDFTKEFYDHIIRCMSQAKDLTATLVALYALQDRFEVFPDEATSRTICLHVARMGVGELTNKGPKLTKHRRNPRRQANVAVTNKIFEMITRQRAETLAEHGMDDLEELHEDIRKKEALSILAEFLRTIIKRTTPQGESAEDNIAQAASQMGVKGIRMDDSLPYHV